MTSNKPYLIRALNEWILENHMTPFLLVDANVEGVEVPRQHIKDGKIILNVAPNAVQGITFENEWIYLIGRFSGQSFTINIPISAVLAIYAKENSQGMMFAEKETLGEDNTGVEQKVPSKKEPKEKELNKKPALRIVK